MTVTMRISSHPLCPHARRAQLLCLAQGVAAADIDRVYIPLDQIKGPVPRYEVGDLVVYDTESAVAYLDETGPRSLLPRTASARLSQRAAARRVHALLDNLRGVFMTADPAVAADALGTVLADLAAVEAETPEGGDGLDWVDVAFAPLFGLARVSAAFRAHPGWHALPRIVAWADRLEADPVVAASWCPDVPGELGRFAARFTA